MKRLYQLSILLLALLTPATATAYDFEVDGIYYNIINDNEAEVTTDGENDFFYSGSVTIPATVTYYGTTYYVTSIGNEAFWWCCSLTSVTIPNSVTSIGENAFYKCTSLPSIEIPNSVTSIGRNAFGGTPWYDNQPDGLVYAGLVAYMYKGTMPAGTQIDLSDGTTGIAAYAFCGSSGLTSVTIPNSVTSIGGYAFYGCSGLTNVTIGNSVTSIGDFAFYGCSGLTNVTIGNSVTSIGDFAFRGCSGLTSVEIPKSVTSIGNSAFAGCNGLKDVYSYIDNLSLVSMGSSVFYVYPANYEERTLHVPVGSLEAYQADTKWSQYFSSIVEMNPVLAESIKLNVTTAGLNEGSSLQLTATVLPEDCGNKTVLWASNNPSVATVDSNGLVTTHGIGTATITAMTADGSNLSTTCTVTLHPVAIKGDVSGDGNVDIADVSTLVDYLLNHSWD